jgi:DNA-binding NtrC family response regulator
LRNVVERLILLSEGETVNGDDVRLVLPGYTGKTGDGGAGTNHHETTGTLAERSEAFERETLISEIRRQNFHMTNVARSLGLERSHLYKKCQQLGIDLQDIRKPA